MTWFNRNKTRKENKREKTEKLVDNNIVNKFF